MKKPAIIIDFDGCLYQLKKRLGHIRGEDWSALHRDAPLEEPNEWCLQIIQKMMSTHRILFVTGRPETYQDEAVEWLMLKCELAPGEYELMMAPPGMQDIQYKPTVYKQHIEPNYDVLFVIDDRPPIVEAWRELGLTCLQPNFYGH